MTKYVKIKKDLNIKFNKQIKEYLSPDYIYIPYKEGSKLNVNSNDKILKNSVLYTNGEVNTYSPVSGKVMGLTESVVGKTKTNTIVIENDFKEKTNKMSTYRKDINNVKKETLLNRLSVLGFNFQLKGEYLLINGIDYEPYESVFEYLITYYSEKLLDGIDALINILKVKKCLFVIKNNNSEIIELLVSQIGTYPNIELRLMHDTYPLGNKEVLINELNLTKKKVIYLNVLDIYNIYYVLKKDEPISETFITISGNLINKSKVLKVKIGTRLFDIIKDEFKVLSDDYHIIVNGLLSGYEINSLNLIITKDIRSIFINSKLNSKPVSCINCGLCTSCCIFKANPRTGYNMDKCIKCGLCNYICPSKIKLVGDKNE